MIWSILKHYSCSKKYPEALFLFQEAYIHIHITHTHIYTHITSYNLIRALFLFQEVYWSIVQYRKHHKQHHRVVLIWDLKFETWEGSQEMHNHVKICVTKQLYREDWLLHKIIPALTTAYRKLRSIVFTCRRTMRDVNQLSVGPVRYIQYLVAE